MDKENKKNKWIGKVIVVAVVLTLIAVLTFLIVNSSTPKKTIDGYLTNLKAGDFEKAQEFVSGEKILNDEEYNIDIQRLFFDKLSWKVIKVNQDNNHATVEIEVTNKDLKTVMYNYMQRLFKLALSGEDITVEENKNYFTEELKSDQLETTTQTKTIQLVKIDSKWKVVSNDELVNILLPGFQEFVDTFEK